MQRSRQRDARSLPVIEVVSSFGWTGSLILDWERTPVVLAPVMGFLGHGPAAGLKRSGEVIP